MDNPKEFVLSILKESARIVAQNYQGNAQNMTNDELYSYSDFFPAFNPEKQYLNYSAGYVCKAPSGNIVQLLQPYDSSIYTQSPEDLPAQWGFKWPTNPKYAKPFIALSTSPYMNGECCTFNGHIWKSGMDNNVWEPGTVGVNWEDLGPIEEH